MEPKNRVNGISHHLQAAQRALQKLMGYKSIEFQHNPWLIEGVPLFQTIDGLLRNRRDGLNDWEIIHMATGNTLMMLGIMMKTNTLLHKLETIRMNLSDYHQESARHQRTLVQPVIAQLELALSELRLAWCELSIAVEDEHLLTYVVPPTIMDGASC